MILLLGGLLLKSVNTFAADKVLETSGLNLEPVSLTEYLAVLEDSDQTLTFAEVQKPDIASRFNGVNTSESALNYGYTNSAYWLRLSLSNSGDRPVERMLELSNPELEQIQFFQPDAVQGYKTVLTGGVLPFATRLYPNNNFVFPIKIEGHASQVFYLRIKSRHVTIRSRLWTPQAFEVQARNYYIGQALYFGMVTAMVLFNMFIFFVIRDVIYLQYAAVVTCTALFIAIQHGLTKQFLPFDSYKWSSISIVFGGLLSMLTALQATRGFLNTQLFLPRVDRLLKVFTGLCLLSLVVLIFLDEDFIKAHSLQIPSSMIYVRSFSIFMLSSLVLIMGPATYSAIKRQRIAYYFLLAFTFPTVGSVMMIFRNMQFLPSNALTNNGLQIGSAMEMLLLAFALADRFSMIRRQAIEDVNLANANLEVRLQMREAEFTETHKKLLEIEQRQTLTQERQRLMQDMHDGLGSSLVSALRVIEQGRMNESEVALVLKGCIDDLKLAIDSMEPVEADLLLLLATFRYRLGPRLESTGIALHWDVHPVPQLDWLDPKNALHILRILQEVFTNIIKHTKATNIRVATSVDNAHVVVTIADNGQGFDIEQALERGGKGLTNQMRRAESIGAEIQWKSNDQGTTIELWLPIMRSQLAV